MLIELTPEERDRLMRLVGREISDLGPEIRHTRTPDFRDDLKAHKRELRTLLAHLRAPAAIEHRSVPETTSSM